MKRKVLPVILAVVLLALLLGGCGGQSAKDPIKLGVMVPLSGPSAATGQEMRNAYMLAAEEINAQGLLGRKVELVIEDSKDPTSAVAALEKLVNREKISILMGEVSSTVGYALAEPAKKYQPLMAWTGAASSKVEGAFKDADWFFHYHPWEYHNVQALVDFLKFAGAKKIAVAYEDGLFGKSSADIMKGMLPPGMEIVASEPFKSGSPDFTPMLTKLKGLPSDAFIWIGYPGDAIPITTQSKEVDYNPGTILAYVPGWPEGFSKLPESEHVTAIVLWTPDVPDANSKKFVEAYKKKYGDAPRSYWAPLAYTNIMTVAEAVKKANSTDKEAVKKALAATEYASPLGQTLKFSPSREIKYQGFTNLITVQWRKGKMEVVYPEKLATGKLVYPAPKWKER